MPDRNWEYPDFSWQSYRLHGIASQNARMGNPQATTPAHDKVRTSIQRPNAPQQLASEFCIEIQCERTFGTEAFMAAARAPRPALPTHDSSTATRFDRRMADILEHATDVFYEKGYDGASMRDLSRATGLSLAGLYYYFESKEKLLYLIQKHTFETILKQLETRLQATADPELRVRAFITNHLEYFLSNQKGMTVLSHEDAVLKGAYGEEIAQIKRQYYRTCRGLVDALKAERGLEGNTRISVLGLFGMMNWIYTWYRPQMDADADELARQLGDLFLHGILAKAERTKNGSESKNGASAERETKAGMTQRTAARNRKTASSTI